MSKRILLAHAMKPLPGNQPLVDAIQKHGRAGLGEPIPALGTPLYTDVRLFCEAGIPGVIYGAGPRTVLESHAKKSRRAPGTDDCAAPPRWWPAHCTTCSPEPGAVKAPARARRRWSRSHAGLPASGSKHNNPSCQQRSGHCAYRKYVLYTVAVFHFESNRSSR